MMSSQGNRTYSWLMNLWIAAILLIFFVIRIIGSAVGQRVLSRIGLHLGS
jgi:hypothetical protein